MVTTGALLSVVQQVERAAEDHLAGKFSDAEAMLRSIDEDALRRERAEFKARLPRNPTTKTVPKKERAEQTVPLKVRVAMFQRDHFICRYCGKQTIIYPTLRIISILYPDAFPYHPNWKLKDGEGHMIHWTHRASCEHIVPLARGGTSAPDNLVTTCYLCNDAKGSALIEELGWSLQPPSTAYWDGLSILFLRLYFSYPAAQRIGDLPKWQQILGEARSKK